jgi:hypothetical protein
MRAALFRAVFHTSQFLAAMLQIDAFAHSGGGGTQRYGEIPAPLWRSRIGRCLKKGNFRLRGSLWPFPTNVAVPGHVAIIILHYLHCDKS